MRVIAGKAGGRTLKAVPGQRTRPTTDKVKEALFSMIGPFFDGGVALDLFAGTGGLGIEAISRGMERAVFVDKERASIEVIQANLRQTGLTEYAEVYRNDARLALKALKRRQASFDLVFLDPPYKMKGLDELIGYCLEHEMLRPAAYVVMEHDADDHYPQSIGALEQIRRAHYGDTAITLYKL